MNAIPTRASLPILAPLWKAVSVKYLKYLLDNCEQDVLMHGQNEALARSRAQELRVELARLGQL